MKKINALSALLVLVLILTSLGGCKEDNGPEATVEVSFNVNNPSATSNGSNKSALILPDPGEIQCQDLMANYAKALINGQEYKITTFYIGGILYTQPIALPAGDYKIEKFVLYNDNQSPNDEADDIPLSAGVPSSSPYAEIVTITLDLNFTITTEKKIEVKIDVLCIDDKTAADLGFEWNRIAEYTLKSFAFFGDFIIKNAADYNASAYSQQSNWGYSPFIDVPAIARIELWHKKDAGAWVLKSTKENSSEGEAIIISYTDKKDVQDSLIIKISVLVKVGQHYDYRQFFEIKLKDGERPLEKCSGGGCTSYYLIGEASYKANYEAPAWNCLPSTATYKIVGNYAPGSLGGYVDAELSGIPADTYEIGNGIYPSYCASYATTIEVGKSYNMNIYSSLYLEDLPAWAQSNKWKKINWLLNHIGLEGSQNYYPGFTWSDLQGAIWLLEDSPWNGTGIGGVPNVNATMQKMASDANANYANYSIPPGGWMCLIFICDSHVQQMFVRWDP